MTDARREAFLKATTPGERVAAVLGRVRVIRYLGVEFYARPAIEKLHAEAVLAADSETGWEHVSKHEIEKVRGT